MNDERKIENIRMLLERRPVLPPTEWDKVDPEMMKFLDGSRHVNYHGIQFPALVCGQFLVPYGGFSGLPHVYELGSTGYLLILKFAGLNVTMYFMAISEGSRYVNHPVEFETLLNPPTDDEFGKLIEDSFLSLARQIHGQEKCVCNPIPVVPKELLALLPQNNPLAPQVPPSQIKLDASSLLSSMESPSTPPPPPAAPPASTVP